MIPHSIAFDLNGLSYTKHLAGDNSRAKIVVVDPVSSSASALVGRSVRDQPQHQHQRCWISGSDRPYTDEIRNTALTLRKSARPRDLDLTRRVFLGIFICIPFVNGLAQKSTQSQSSVGVVNSSCRAENLASVLLLGKALLES